METILYIEAIDIHSLYGSGGGPMFRYSNLVSDQFVYLTFTSGSERLGQMYEKDIGGQCYKFVPICRTIRSPFFKPLIPLNLYFAFRLLFRKRLIDKLNSECIFTKTNTVLWLFTLVLRGRQVCYVFPGLASSAEIGRFPKLGGLLGSLLNWINTRSYDRVDAMFVAASNADIELKNNEMAVKGVSSKIIKIPQAVDQLVYLDKPKLLARENLGITDRYVFSFLGRMAQVKGVDLIIQSFSYFSSKHPSSRLYLIGNGENISSLKAIVISLKLEKNVEFVGNISPPKLIDYICASDAGVFASYAEGFSNAMLEFLSCGVPIVSTVVGGVDELIIENRTGVRVQTRDVEDYLNALERVLRISDQRGCRELVEENYTLRQQWRVISDNWMPLKLNFD